MDNNFKILSALYPGVKFVTAADIVFLRECHIDPATDCIKSKATGEIILARALCLAFKVLREAFGKPLSITQGYRSDEDQQRLIREGYHAVKDSPHVYGMAFDIPVPKGWTNEKFAQFVIKTLKGQCRVGWRIYVGNQNIIHLDLAFLLKDKNGKSPDPVNFKAGVTW